MTDKEKAELVEAHHQADEMNRDFQKSIRALAARCFACGQPLPEKKEESADNA